jgi:hypothetical protein
MKRGVTIGIVAGIVLILLIIGFFVLTNSSNNQNNNQDLNQDTFSSCQASTRTTPFGQGNYVIKVIGIENGNCHWQFSLQSSNSSQTKDCNYPLAKMSNDAFNHLFGQDKTGTECSSDVCKQQDSLQQTHCKTI